MWSAPKKSIGSQRTHPVKCEMCDKDTLRQTDPGVKPASEGQRQLESSLYLFGQRIWIGDEHQAPVARPGVLRQGLHGDLGEARIG